MSKKIIITGNDAVGNVAYKFSEINYIYPISPSSEMADIGEKKASNKELNVFNAVPKYIEMQSEAGVAGAMHGALISGSLSTAFTCSQGLLLMIPNMYKIAGEMLPGVIHVASRTLATHALNISCDHSDILATKHTGWNMICSNNTQEAQDLAFISHVLAIEMSLPVLHFFDGQIVSHEINLIEDIDNEVYEKLFPIVQYKKFKNSALSNINPYQIGTNQGPDVYFQNYVAREKDYANVANVFNKICNNFFKETKRKYEAYQYVGAENPTILFVSMGSSCDTIEKFIQGSQNEYGLIKIHLFAFFDVAEFCNKINHTVKKIIVLDRVKDFSSSAQPLYLEVLNALNKQNIIKNVALFNGIYGLGGKKFDIQDIYDIIDNVNSTTPLLTFYIGINDDISYNSISNKKDRKNLFDNTKKIKIYGIGGDGTLTLSSLFCKILFESDSLYTQNIFEHDSKKTNGKTCANIRVSSMPIINHESIYESDITLINKFSLINDASIYENLKNDSIIILNTTFDANHISLNLPPEIKKTLVLKNIDFYTVDCFKIANENNLGNKYSIILLGALLKIFKFKNVEIAQNLISKTFSGAKKEFCDSNLNAFKSGFETIKNMSLDEITSADYVNNEIAIKASKIYTSIIQKIENNHSDTISTNDLEKTGKLENNTTIYNTMPITDKLPVWNANDCITCGKCIASCPHAAIRSFLTHKTDNVENSKELKNDMNYTIAINPLACTGCENCANNCPKKCFSFVKYYDKNIEYAQLFNKLEEKNLNHTIDTNNVTFNKLQYLQPYFRYHSACAGCSGANYIKILTQLFNKTLIIANATGCSSIYSASYPYNPFFKDKQNLGPSWGNSLFEDNAEYGMAMSISYQNKKEILTEKIKTLNFEEVNEMMKKLDEENDIAKKYDILNNITIFLLNLPKSIEISYIIANINDLIKKDVWIIGGDGWAYDIDFNGLDNIFKSNINTNILILDNELYANTGGQASSSTPYGAVAKFQSAGKQTQKKDFANYVLNYPNVFVAQISGNDIQNIIDAFTRAAKHNGPSVIIAYSQCIQHGIKLNNTFKTDTELTECGYANEFIFDPSDSNYLNTDVNFDNYINTIKTQRRYAKLTDEKAETNKKHAQIKFKKLEDKNN